MLAGVILLIVLFASAAFLYTVPDSSESAAGVLTEWQEAQSTWAENRPSTVRYRVERICECRDDERRPYLVEDRDGRLDARLPVPIYSSSGEATTVPPRVFGIDDLFKKIGDAIDEGVEFEVRYDTTFGYPRRLVIGVSPGEQQRFEIVDFIAVDGY